MPNIRWTTFATLLVLAAWTPDLAAAQDAPIPRPGEQVRVRIVGPATAPVVYQRCAGSVAAVEGDTVVLGRPHNCPGGSYEAELRIARGQRGSRLEHSAKGFGVGALVGGILVRLGAGDGCAIEGCDDGGLFVVVNTMIGAVLGGVIGAVGGALLPAGPQWLRGTAKGPIRVAGLELRPELRVSFDDRRGH